MMWSSMNGLFSGGRTAVHINSSSNAPAPAARFMNTPSMSAAPMPSKPSMKSQSAQIG